MPFQFAEGIRYYQFGSFGDDLTQAVFTRNGGLSPEPWKSLNLGGTVGDIPERVQQNRLLALRAMGRNPQSVYEVWQVHGVNVVIADEPRQHEEAYLQADAILSNTPGVTLLMRFADCVPIMLFDPENRVIGIVHAGWMGTVLGVIRHAVGKMQTHFGSQPASIRAGIGPSIGPDHYEIGPDVAAKVRQTFGKNTSSLLREEEGKIKFDLWEANRLLLNQIGVEQIEIAGLCTACHTEDWYSHRAEKGRTGRFGSMIALHS